tara:strand:- start:83 stop:724 length:642 start_codon:yes stop_codon:yes gene_type:complete
LIAIVIGATGATGTALLEQLIIDNLFSKIIVFSRTKPLISSDKIIVNIVDFEKIELWKDKIIGDVLFSALGTTKKDAGSKEAQYKVDFTYQYNFALSAAENKVKKILLVSSFGANDKSNFFYPKIKGELETAVAKMSFNNIVIFQPPVLIRQEEKIRIGEKIIIKIINALNKIGFLASQKPMSVHFLAKKMIYFSKQVHQKKILTLSPKDIFN